jgi:predicted RNA-binding Zn-ribbon protein involved in translation (DUF1610 family)
MNDDLISRAALKQHITEIFEIEKEIDTKWAMGLKYSLKLIDNAPTVDTQAELIVARSQGYELGFAEGYEEGFAKGKESPIDDLSEYSDKLWQRAYERGKAEPRPQGKWIEDSVTFACSECGTHAVWIGNNDFGLKPYISNFCPNCGADMRGEKNE